MKPATVRLLARLDAYRPKSDAVCSRVLKYMIRTRMRQVIEFILTQTPENTSHFAMRIALFSSLTELCK